MAQVFSLQAKRMAMQILHALLPQKSDTVVFFSFSGATYSDNPKAISQSLAINYPRLRQIWIFSDPEKKQNMVSPTCRIYRKWGVRALCALAQARVWVLNDTLPAWAWKGKNQYFIQTWHGDRGFKKILYDFSERKDKPPLQEQYSCDLAVAGSDFGESFYRTAFRYQGEVMKTGCPRNDCLVDANTEKRRAKLEELKLDTESNYVLYAPTLRKMTGKSRTAQQVQNLDFLQILETLEHTFDGRWIFLVRSHVKVPGLQGVPDSAAILDVSKIEDMADLLLVSDFLITDYSSSAGDFALKGKPIVLYQDDRTTYEANERTFYFELGSSPFWITTNQEELIQTIQDIPNRSVEKNCRDILEFYGANETGNSSLDSAKKIADWCNCHA